MPRERRDTYELINTARFEVASGRLFDAVFAGSVSTLHQANLLDATVIHGDGTTTAAKKGATTSVSAATEGQRRQNRRLLRSQL